MSSTSSATTCIACGTSIDSGGLFCKKCISSNTQTCSNCNKTVYKWNIKFFNNFNRVRFTSFLEAYPDPICTECFDSLHTKFPLSDPKPCMACGTYTLNKFDYGVYCDRCNKDLVKCKHCKKLYPKQVLNQIITKSKEINYLCGNCVDEESLVYNCRACGKLAEVDLTKLSLTKKSTCSICSDRYSICHLCGRGYESSTAMELPDGHGSKICPNCAALAPKYVCSDCKRSSVSLKFIDNEVGRRATYCIQCAAKRGKADKQSWNYSPPRLFYHGRTKNNLYFGFENEVIVTGKSSRKTYAVLANILAKFPSEKLYCKFDGSIGGTNEDHGEYGFELISHPHTFEEIKSTDWSGMFNRSLVIDPTCGMHIHINKGAFTTFHLYKFINFIYFNPKFIEFIAQRKPNVYCRPNMGELLKEDSKKKYKKRGPGDIYRRVQVNLCSLYTVELRFFSNVNSVNGLMKNIEFAHALFHFTRDSSKIVSSDVERFKEYVRKFPEFYPNLISFLDKGVI